MAAPGQLSFYRVVADPQQGSHALARGHQVGVGDAQPGLAHRVQRRCHQRLHCDVPIAVAGRKAPGQILSLGRRPLAQLRQWAATEGKYLTGRFSPGYGDWDIAVQPLVAAALDTVRKAGLCVTDTNLMTPRKSVTALLGVSDHPVKGQLAGCGHCVLRTRCEYRKRGKTCASE